MLKEYRTWQAITWPRLNLTKRERDEIGTAILNSTHDLRTCQEAVQQILDGLDVGDSYSHAGNKLAAGLADKAAAIAARRELKEKRRAYLQAMAEAQAAGNEQFFNELAQKCERETQIPGELPEMLPRFERKRSPTEVEEERRERQAALNDPKFLEQKQQIMAASAAA